MSMQDLFNWLHAAVYNDLGRTSIPLVRRNLQALLVDKLSDVANKPEKGTPPDAQSLARAELRRIASDASRAMHGRHDEATSAHLTDLVHRANGALK